ncbi:MAG: methylenetetrahydrofolate reductase C-terminal domain-containing protein [Nitrospirota bacterium]
MIISKSKEKQDVINMLDGVQSVFLIGCSECASLCGTGSPEALAEMKQSLENIGKKVTGTFVAKTGCQVLGTKVELKGNKEEVEAADAILVMSCGAGTQSMVEVFKDKKVYPANDTAFLGNMTRFQHFDERCSMCGECIIDKTGGICPVTTCPKGILNGPCGGTNNGFCEVSPDIECAWAKIYARMERTGELDKMKEIIPPKDYSKKLSPKVFVIEKKKEEK